MPFNIDTVFGDIIAYFENNQSLATAKKIKAGIKALGDDKYEIFSVPGYFPEDWYESLQSAELLKKGEQLSQSNNKEDLRKAAACFQLVLLLDAYRCKKFENKDIADKKVAVGEEKAGAATAAASTTLTAKASSELTVAETLADISAVVDFRNLGLTTQSLITNPGVIEADAVEQQELIARKRCKRTYKALSGRVNCLIRLGKGKDAIVSLSGEVLAWVKQADSDTKHNTFSILKTIVVARALQIRNGVFPTEEAAENAALHSEAWLKVICAKRHMINMIQVKEVMAATISLEAFLALILLTTHHETSENPKDSYSLVQPDLSNESDHIEGGQVIEEMRPYTHSEHLKRAAILFEQAENLDRSSSAPKLGFALIDLAKGNYQDAAKKLAQASEAAQDVPNKLEFYRQLATFLIATRKNWDLATETLDLCFAIEPGYPPALILNDDIKFECSEEAMSKEENREQASAEALKKLEKTLLESIALKQPALEQPDARQQETEEKAEASSSRAASSIAPKAAMWKPSDEGAAAAAAASQVQAAAAAPQTQAAAKRPLFE